MSSLNSIANGARLDDCHSTIFSLADLSGIQWQKFSSDANGLNEDPALSAFTRCLALDILAVWRRAPNKSSDSSSRHAQEKFSKELWVFWWGEEPHVDEMLLNRGLKDEGRGCWDEGLTYECRTLLFKAIHNLVERCLLHENFVRIGQWFVKPLLSKEADEDVSDRFSFSFTFFLHGESSVCTTVEVGHHKSLERLTYQDFQRIRISANPSANSVILAPYGLEAKLSGVSYRSHDPVAKKLLEEWKSFYPLANFEDTVMEDMSVDDDNNEHIPIHPVVEVILDGIYMNYPSHFVLMPLHESSSTDNVHGKDDNALDAEGCSSLSKNSNYELMSVQSASELTSSLTQDFEKSFGSSHSQPPSNHRIKADKQKQQFNENVLQQPRYFANRIRVKNKLSCASLQNSVKSKTPVDTANETISKPSLPSNASIKWQFQDPFKETRQVDHMSSVNDSWKSTDRQNRPASYGSFHHRLVDCSDENSRQAEKLPIVGGAPTPKEMFQQQPTPDSIFPVDFPQQVPQDILPSLFEDPVNKFNSKPFVSLGSVGGSNTAWLNEEPMKPDPVDFTTCASTDTDFPSELHKLVDIWETYKLPSDLTENSSKQKRLSSDCLDNATVFSAIAGKSYYRPRTKRLKDSSCEVGNSTGAMKTEGHPEITQSCAVQQVSVGSATGELAGMAVSSDPYAFEDVEDTIIPSVTYSEISLKKSHTPLPVSQAPWQPPHIYNSQTMENGSHVPTSGKSELKKILTQNNFPAAAGDFKEVMPITSAPYTTAIPAAASNAPKHLEFSMEDLNYNVMEPEDPPGAPTPPQEPCDNHIHDTVAAATAGLPGNAVSHAVTDLQRMFPTPPSLEAHQAFSPEGRVLHPVVTSTQVGYKSANELDQSACKRESDKSDGGFPSSDNSLSTSLPSVHDGPSVLQMNSKILCHPISELYQPLPHLAKLPHQLTYERSWPVSSSIPPIVEDCIAALPGYSMNPPSTPTMTPGGATPCTPGHTSIRTPASVQPTSVPTPGRTGLCSIESTQSYRTPSSHGANRVHCSDPHGSAALHMNLLLSDSVMNIFRDKSFDQCALCVCNTNILGSDVALGYLPALTSQEAQYQCACGFSAIRNRLASVGTGLFLEDELEIAGLEHESEIIESHKQVRPFQPLNDEHLFSLVVEHCTSPFTVSRLIRESKLKDYEKFDNVLVKRDKREALAQALSIGLSTIEQPVKIEASSLVGAIHPWKKTQSDILSCGSLFDLYRLLVSLKPVLQDAIQRKRVTRSFGCTQHVRGPLTWREFCKEAGKNAEPQPIPSFVVGYDHDWLVVSPHALKYWEKLFLEPYSEQRNLAYLVICPDDDRLVNASRSFFKEMSSMFESCRLGHLKPYNKKFTDGGIVRVGQQSTDDQSVTGSHFSWLSLYNSSECGEGSNLISLYSRMFAGELSTMLRTEQNLDLTSLHVRTSQAQPPTPSSGFHPASGDRMPPPMNVGSGLLSRPSPVSTQSPSKVVDTVVHSTYNAETASVIVLYIIDPFDGILSHALWRCFLSLQKSLPSPVKDHLLLQIVPVDTILQATSSTSAESPVKIFRSLCFSTFAHCRTSAPPGGSVRSMTGFGPKLANRPLTFLHSSLGRSLYAPLYVLADLQDKRTEPLDSTNCNSVLYVCYCLSRDQKWLLATATDHCGEILEPCCINIEVPPRRLALSRKQRRLSVRSGAIEKLWKFCVSTCLQHSNNPWRVVIGKLGRLSHAEIQDWSKHLNKRVLQSCGRRASCQQCKLQQMGDSFILSACLTSLEPDATLRILPDVVQSNNFGRGTSSLSQSGQLKTPDDVSCTHIYVFPTSAETQSPGSNQAGGEEDATGILPDDVDLDDFFKDLPAFIDPASPVQPSHHFSVVDDDVMNKPHGAADDVGQVEEASLLQQPLALGYLVSTAPAGPLPGWFWTTCPQAKHRCPVFMKSALHIRATVNDAAVESSQQHPLDSSKTSVVLRFVLENYNALSWLTRDPVSRDRRSCLPLHFLSLAQLYHTVENLFYGSVQ